MARIVDEGTASVVAAAAGKPGAPGAADAPDAPAGPGGTLAHQVLRALRGLRYGSVEITVHDGEIVQIERREKVRLERGPGRRAG